MRPKVPHYVRHTGWNTAARYARRRSRSVRGATRLATATPPALSPKSRYATCAAHGTSAQPRLPCQMSSLLGPHLTASRGGPKRYTTPHISYVSGSSDAMQQQQTGRLFRRDGVPQGGHSRSANHSRSSTLGKPLSVKPLSFQKRSRAVRRLTPGQVRHAGQKRTQRIQG